VNGGLLGGDSITIFSRLFMDLNGDKAVNGIDLAEFRNAFGAFAADANYRSDLDFNGDGVINVSDLAAFRTRFGTILT
jgi:Dockerin type I domain